MSLGEGTGWCPRPLPTTRRPLPSLPGPGAHIQVYTAEPFLTRFFLHEFTWSLFELNLNTNTLTHTHTHTHTSAILTHAYMHM